MGGLHCGEDGKEVSTAGVFSEASEREGQKGDCEDQA